MYSRSEEGFFESRERLLFLLKNNAKFFQCSGGRQRERCTLLAVKLGKEVALSAFKKWAYNTVYDDPAEHT